MSGIVTSSLQWPQSRVHLSGCELSGLDRSGEASSGWLGRLLALGLAKCVHMVLE